MSEPNEKTTALEKTDTDKVMTYAKWGLMGIGALWLVKITAGVILSPWGLLAVAGGGGYAWWHFKSKRGGEAPSEAIVTPPPASQAASVAPVRPPPAASPVPVPQRGSAAPMAPPAGPSPAVPGFAADELAEFDRRLAELDGVD